MASCSSEVRQRAAGVRLLARFHDGGCCIVRLPSVVDSVSALATTDEARTMLADVAAEIRQTDPLEDPLPTRVPTNPENRAALPLFPPRQGRLHASDLQEVLLAWRMATEERLRRFFRTWRSPSTGQASKRGSACRHGRSTFCILFCGR
jgi:hypothetical protein